MTALFWYLQFIWRNLKAWLKDSSEMFNNRQLHKATSKDNMSTWLDRISLHNTSIYFTTTITHHKINKTQDDYIKTKNAP